MRWFIIVLSFLTIFNSCVNHKKFTIFMDPFSMDSISLKINLSGGYYYTEEFNNSQIEIPLYLYSDGKIKYHRNWGHYRVTGNSIYIQYFYVDQQNFYKYNTIELFGRIMGDSAIHIDKKRCVWCEGVYAEYKEKTELLFKEPRVFYFIKGKKPDSTQCWFNNKKWYLRNVHEIRKD